MVVGAAAAGPIVPSRPVLSGYILKYLGIDTQALISGVDDPGMTCTATLLQGFGFQTPPFTEFWCMVAPVNASEVNKTHHNNVSYCITK